METLWPASPIRAYSEWKEFASVWIEDFSEGTGYTEKQTGHHKSFPPLKKWQKIF